MVSNAEHPVSHPYREPHTGSSRRGPSTHKGHCSIEGAIFARRASTRGRPLRAGERNDADANLVLCKYASAMSQQPYR